MYDTGLVRIEDMNGTWVETLRTQARGRVSSLQVPTYKNENYRFTSVKDISWDRSPQALSALPPLPVHLTQASPGEVGVVAVRSGHATGCTEKMASSEHLKSLLAQGVIFTDLLSLLKDSNARALAVLKNHLGLAGVFHGDVFANQAAAHWQNGVVVYVPRNVKVDGVLRGLHWFDEASGVFFHRTLVVADEGSEVTYVDEFAGDGAYAGSGDRPAALGLVDVVAARGAKVTYAQVQNWGAGSHYVLRQNMEAHQESSLRYIPLFAGGKKGQVRTESFCKGTGSAIHTWGAVRGHGEEHFDFWSTTTHAVAHTSSGLDYWAVMGGKAKAVFNGKIVITTEGRQTEAYQKNRNMLLSREAEIDTLPKLEIATDDVKCAHGASVASVQEDQLYYLQSRGISRSEAEEMIIRGFTDPVIRELPCESLRARVSALFDRKSEVTL